MNSNIMNSLPKFLKTLGLDEEPMGLFYTDKEPDDGFAPKPNDLPTRKKEMSNETELTEAGYAKTADPSLWAEGIK